MSSRKWEREIYRNQKKVNDYRKRAGQNKVSASSQYDIFKGRSILLPVLLIGVGLLYGIMFYGLQESDTLYWITFVAYIFLGLWFLFFRKPYLKVGKNELATRKWGRERIVNAQRVEFIQIQGSNIVIKIRQNDKLWVFSRIVNLYKIDEMAARLKEFALKNQVKFISSNE